MKLEGENVLCRILTTNFIQHHHRPLYEAIVEKAWKHGMAGATVIKGILGFMLDSPIFERHPWWPANQLPMVVEIVDERARVMAFLAKVAPLFSAGIITVERAHVVYYRASERPEDVGPVAPRVDVEPLEEGEMELKDEAVLVRIFVDDGDKDPQTGKCLYERLVRIAKEKGLAGATVLHGTMGFGKHSVMHAAKLIDTSMDMPVVIELVDEEVNMKAYLDAIDGLVTEGLVTMERVHVLKYSARSGD